MSSFFTLFLAFALAFFYFLSWPLRLAFRALRRSGSKGEVERVIILGLDGMDPRLAERFMGEGKLPHFCRLREEGTFAPLTTSYPSISPSAWSSFMTGVDPSRHSIFDFFTRDPCTYMPVLSSAEIGRASRFLPLGKYRLPLGKPKVRLLRKSQPFWKILGERGVFSSILRVPITFPPEKFRGVLLSGMCTPDLRGSQGLFSFYTTDPEQGVQTGGSRHLVALDSRGTVRTHLLGPENPLVPGEGELKAPLTIRVDLGKGGAEVEVSGQRLWLKPKEYSPWLRVTFRPGLGVKIRGICRFYLDSLTPHLRLYVTPIHIDPEKPALPISHPFIYAVYLAKLLGPYGTLGLAEDTWALNEGVLDEEGFLKQAYLFYEERERMLFAALEKTPRGLCTCVFDTPDRIQHMFFRCLDPTHPANRGREVERYRTVIEDLYRRMDSLVGRVLEQVDRRTVLFVVSDHGFTQFRRGVNLNTWLFREGYLVLRDGRTTSGEWFEGVDWERTRAFALGLGGIFINRRGREACGAVAEGEELRKLKRELRVRLTGLRDGELGKVAIREVVDTEEVFPGPYADEAPDLLIGYNAGYRSSWECAVGKVGERVFEDNTKSWSGDHCVDPKLVPGVFFSNRKINTSRPDIKDIAPTVLRLFGVEIPPYMQGRPLVGVPGEESGRAPAELRRKAG